MPDNPYAGMRRGGLGDVSFPLLASRDVRVGGTVGARGKSRPGQSLC